MSDLLTRDVPSCGTIRENRRGFPRVQNNALAKNQCGTMHLLRISVEQSDTYVRTIVS